MSDDTIRLATIGRIIRRRRRLLAVLALVGALVGYGTSLLFPPRYTTSASVLLPGAWEERELLTQAEIATSSVGGRPRGRHARLDRGQRQRAAGPGERQGRRREHHQDLGYGRHPGARAAALRPGGPAVRHLRRADRGRQHRPRSGGGARGAAEDGGADQPPHHRPGRGGRSGADRGERADPHRAREAAHLAAGGHQQAGRRPTRRPTRPTWSSWGRRPGRPARHRRRGCSSSSPGRCCSSCSRSSAISPPHG